MADSPTEKSPKEGNSLFGSSLFGRGAGKQPQPKDEGVRPWIVCLGSFSVLVATFGYVNTFGVFLTYYKSNFLSSYSISAINWIGSVQLFCMYFFSPLVGKLFDTGYFRHSFLVGSALHIIGIFTLSVADSYAGVFLSQGLCQGIGLGLIFLPSQAVLSHWFQKRRALALGISALGSSLGGVVFPIMLRRLLETTTFKTTVLALGGCTTFCLVVANLTLEVNRPPNAWKNVSMFDPNAVKQLPFVLFTIGVTLVMWGLYVPIFYVEDFGLQHHLPPDVAFYSLSILNGASFFGRSIPNALADYFAPITLLTPMCFVCGVLMLAWLACTKTASYIVFTALYGFFSGAYVSLLPAAVASFVPNIGLAGTWLGMVLFCISFAGLTGTPITGAILNSTATATSTGYWGPAAFGACAVFLGTAFLLVSIFLTRRK